MGGGVRATVLDTTSAAPVAPVAPVAPAASSQNADLAAIRVTSELTTSSDTFVLCAGCGVGKGRGAPVQARAPREQLSTEKHTGFGRLFFRFLPNGAKRLVFTMNSTLRDDQDFAYSDIFQLWPHRAR